MTRRPFVVLLTLLALLAAGCASLPTSGPVVPAGTRGAVDTRLPSDIDPPTPRPGASPLDIVNGFLEAMTAWPVSTTVAKKYLTADAQHGWNPEAQTIVYDNVTPPAGDSSRVSVELSGASRLDSSGAWRGAVPAAQESMTFRVVLEDGEYRIADPPDALVVPTTWFQQRFGQVDLYFFETQARYLVPEPVYVPQGEQLPTALVSALLAGPRAGLDGVVRSFLPDGISAGLSVPVTPTGVADINLTGGQARPSAQVADLMLAQIAATLRQDPSITGFRVTLNGDQLRSREGDEDMGVDFGSGYDAVAALPASPLFGLARGRLVSGVPARMTPVGGPLGTSAFAPEQVAVAPDGRRAVAVTDGGSTAIVAPLGSGTTHDVRTVISGAASLARPTIDLLGRVWLLDRRPQGAIVRCLVGEHLETVDVPGVTGADARQLLVSRDGTRLVSVVHRARGDVVLASRVATVPGPVGVSVLRPSVVPTGGVGHEVLGVAWAAPTRLAILTPATPDALFQVDIVPEDGSTIGADTLSAAVNGKVLGLAGSPDPSQATYAVLKDALVDVRTRSETPLPGHVTALGYAG